MPWIKPPSKIKKIAAEAIFVLDLFGPAWR
jgi:hypothetical protein